MDYETKLFDTSYLKARVEELKEIRSKTLGYRIEKSDRANSKSTYIIFTAEIANGVVQDILRLRISDHPLNNYSKQHFDTTYIVNEHRVLDKKRKALFMRTLQNCATRAKCGTTRIALGKIKGAKNYDNF